MESLIRDLRLALRALRRSPVVFGAAVSTLAAGTGLATAVFALAYGLLLRPLPYADADRLVVVGLVRGPGGRASNVPLAEIDEWRKRLRTFERVAGVATADLTLRGAGEPRSVRAALITEDFFETLGVSAAEGRAAALTREDAAAAFSRRFAGQIGDRAWRERGVTIGTTPFAFGAVMPAGFAYPSESVDVWIRADAVPGLSVFTSSDMRRYQLFGRLAPGATVAQALEDVRRVGLELDAATSPAPPPREVSVVTMPEHGRTQARTTVVLFAAGAGLVLLIACANVSGLLVGRVMWRQRDLAVRRALGAGRGDVLRSAVCESAIVAFSGWALGLWLAQLVIVGFHAFAADVVSNLHTVRMDTPVIAASLMLAVVVALVSGGAPALRAVRTDPGNVLKQSSERTTGARTALRSTLVVSQIAMTVVLLVSAGLLMRTVVGLLSAERGFDSRPAVVQRIMLTEAIRYNALDRGPLVDRLLAEVRALPGVTAAGIGSDIPPRGTPLTMTISLVGENRRVTSTFNYTSVTPGYLEALGVTPIAGRLLEDRDRFGDRRPVVITESTARMFFEAREAVGRELPAALPGGDGRRARPLIVGVIRDIEYGGLDRAAGGSIFNVWETLAPGNVHLVVRAAGRPLDLGPALQRAVRHADPGLPLFPLQTLDEVVSASIADRRLRLQLAAVFAALALALAAVAIWGAVAQSVLDRRREIAVRLALGSTHRGAVALLLRGGVVLTVTGIAIGVAGSAAAARAIRHLLYGVPAWDPVSFAAGAAITAAIAILACYIPARRAAAIDPSRLLKG